MRSGQLRGVQLSMWWVDLYTRTLPDSMRAERRDELRADLHDQASDGLASGAKPGRLSREIATRSLRGVPADLRWRFDVEWERDRLAALLSHPSTLLTFLFALLLPLNLVWDLLLETGPALRPFVAGLRFVVWLLALVLVIYALAVSLFWLTSGRRVRRAARRSPIGLGRRVLRFSVPAMFFFFALSGLWRFSPDPLGQISAAAYALFGVTLLCNLTGLVIIRLTTKTSLHLEKVPS